MNNLHVYSAGCSWHGNISEVGKTEDLPITTVYVGNTPIKIGGPGSGLPCCPHCGSMLFQIAEDDWWKKALEFQYTHPNYIAFLKWTNMQKRCWPSNSAASVAYNAANPKLQYTHFR